MIKISFFEAFHALKLFVMRCFNPVLIPGHTSPLVYVAGMIFDPLNKLKASCRHMASRIFFAIVVNRALNAPPSCKWLNRPELLRFLIAYAPRNDKVQRPEISLNQVSAPSLLQIQLRPLNYIRNILFSYLSLLRLCAMRYYSIAFR